MSRVDPRAITDGDLLALIEAVPAPIALVDLNGTFLITSRRFLEVVSGRRPLTVDQAEQLRAECDNNAVTLVGRHLAHDIGRSFRLASSGAPARLSVQRLRNGNDTGDRLVVWLNGVTGPDGRVAAVAMGTGNDFSELAAAAAAALPGVSVDHGVGEWLYDANNNVSQVNDEWLAMMGYKRDDLGDQTVAHFWSSKMHPEDHLRLRAMSAHRQTPIVEYRMRHADGVYRWMRSEAQPVTLNTDQSVGVARGIMYNYDEERRNRTAVESALERSLEMLDSSAEGIISANSAGVVLSANIAALQLLNAYDTAVVGRHLDEVLVLTDGTGRLLTGQVLARSLSRAGTTIPEATLRRFDGQEITVSISIGSSSGSGAVLADTTLVRIRDIGHLLELAAQRDLDERLQALGRMASSIAHDFNNLLAVASGAGELIAGDPMFSALSSSARESVRLMQQSCARAADLTARLLPFPVKPGMTAAETDIHISIEGVADSLGFTLDRSFSFAFDLQASNTIVRVEPSTLDSALLNIVLNAQQAMPDGGTITFRTRDLDLTGNDRRIAHFALEPGPHCEVEVIDTGIGIPAAEIDRCFEPFYSNRPGGTGLGLVGVFRFVTESRGAVEIESEVGSGTTVRMVLPVFDAESMSRSTDVGLEALGPEERNGDGGHRIARSVLVAEDQEIVAEVMRSLISSLGGSADIAVDGFDLIARLEGDHDYDLVLLDLRMPGMSGMEALIRLREIDPDVPVFIVSGLISPEDEKALREAGADDLAQKPVTRARLAELLQAAGAMRR